MSATVRPISRARAPGRIGSIRLLADLLSDAEAEVTKLRTLMVKNLCTCRTQHADRLDVAHHRTHCRYRELLS